MGNNMLKMNPSLNMEKASFQHIFNVIIKHHIYQGILKEIITDHYMCKKVSGSIQKSFSTSHFISLRGTQKIHKAPNTSPSTEQMLNKGSIKGNHGNIHPRTPIHLLYQLPG